MLKGLSPSVRDVVRRAEEQGWRAERTSGGHLKFKHECGAVVFGAATPSDHRSIKNLVAMMSRKTRSMST